MEIVSRLRSISQLLRLLCNIIVFPFELGGSFPGSAPFLGGVNSERRHTAKDEEIVKIDHFTL